MRRFDYGIDVYYAPPYRIATPQGVIYVPVLIGNKHFSTFAHLAKGGDVAPRVSICFVLGIIGAPEESILLSVTGTATLGWNEKVSSSTAQPRRSVAIVVVLPPIVAAWSSLTTPSCRCPPHPRGPSHAASQRCSWLSR
jgi:hypothetical protein